MEDLNTENLQEYKWYTKKKTKAKGKYDIQKMKQNLIYFKFIFLIMFIKICLNIFIRIK